MAKKWQFEDIPDQSGKVAIITGSNSGLGFEETKALARKGAHVIMACRNLEKAEKAKNNILSEYPNVSLEIMKLDLSDLSSVKKFVEEFKKKHQKLDLLINNAGIMMLPKKQTTIDGFEKQLGTNHFGHFALTGLLLDTILNTENSRVVSVSSFAHSFGKMNFKDLNWEKSYKRIPSYARSKLANLLFSYELDRKLKAEGSNTISSIAHPGWTRTDLQRHSGFFRFLNPVFGMRPPQGALPILYAATAEDVKGGDFFGPDGLGGWNGYPTKTQSNKRSRNLDDAKKLWEISEELTGVKFPI